MSVSLESSAIINLSSVGSFFYSTFVCKRRYAIKGTTVLILKT